MKHNVQKIVIIWRRQERLNLTDWGCLRTGWGAGEETWAQADEISGGRKKLHHEQLHNLYISPSVIRVMKSRRTRLAGNAARLVQRRCAYRISARKTEEYRPLVRPRRRWRIILCLIWQKKGGGVDSSWFSSGLLWTRQWTVLSSGTRRQV
jgi:hypothetical protein